MTVREKIGDAIAETFIGPTEFRDEIVRSDIMGDQYGSIEVSPAMSEMVEALQDDRVVRFAALSGYMLDRMLRGGIMSGHYRTVQRQSQEKRSRNTQPEVHIRNTI